MTLLDFCYFGCRKWQETTSFTSLQADLWNRYSNTWMLLWSVSPRIMMTSSNGNIFRVIGQLCGEFTGDRWIPRTEARSFDVFFDLRLNKRLSKQSWGWWFETPSRPQWRHCYVWSLNPANLRWFSVVSHLRCCPSFFLSQLFPLTVGLVNILQWW